jgi:hypothetical protein
MPPRARTNPKDFTGQQKARLQEEHAKELADKREHLAMVQQAEIEGLDIPIAQDGSGFEKRLTEEEIQAVDVDPQWVEIRVNCDIENATIGYDNTYNFREGQKYKVPAYVARWLDYLGYVWH